MFTCSLTNRFAIPFANWHENFSRIIFVSIGLGGILEFIKNKHEHFHSN